MDGHTGRSLWSLPAISRRTLLQCGGIALAGVSLPEVLASEASPRGGTNKQPAEKSCIFIYQYGGLSQLDSWDLKPHAPAEQRGPYKPIATSVPGYFVGELMPKLAKLADRYAIVRSLTHQVPVHDVANRMLLAGQSQPAADAPSLGSIVTRLKPAEQDIPAHVWLQKFGGGAAPPDASYLTGGFLGMASAPLLIGNTHDDNPAAEGFRVKALDTAQDVPHERLAERKRLLGDLQTADTGLGSAARPRTMQHFQQRAYDLITGPTAREAFDISQEPSPMRDRYGRHPLGQNLLLARRLIEAGVRLVNVAAWCGLAPGDKFLSVETWDMHGNAGIDIFGNGWNGLGWALPCCDQAVAALLEDLEERGLLDSTLVVLVGEFGRTPTISRGSKAIGRDHWPHCYSGLLAGAGIRGGAQYGQSDSRAAYVKDKPVSLEGFAATLLHALGIDPDTRLSPDGFTRPASSGLPVLDLFG